MTSLQRLSDEMKLHVLSNMCSTLIGTMTMDGEAKAANLIADCIKELESEGHSDPLLHPAMCMALLAVMLVESVPDFNFRAFVDKKDAELRA